MISKPSKYLFIIFHDLVNILLSEVYLKEALVGRRFLSKINNVLK